MERNDAERKAKRGLVELLGWVRAKLETLHDGTSDAYTRWSLHALIRACDPDTNPRLRSVLEELDLFAGEVAPQVPPAPAPQVSEENDESVEERR